MRTLSNHDTMIDIQRFAIYHWIEEGSHPASPIYQTRGALPVVPHFFLRETSAHTSPSSVQPWQQQVQQA